MDFSSFGRTLKRLTGLGGAPSAVAFPLPPTVPDEQIVPRVRSEEEFAAVLAEPARTFPRRRVTIFSWSLDKIRAARDAQLLGDFALPVAMAKAMRTDDAIFNAYRSRIAPQQSVSTRLVGSGRSKDIARKAERSVFVSRATLSGIHGTFANHGLAIGHITRQTNDDGTRTDFMLKEWPLEFVRWRPHERLLYTQTLGGPMVPIVHGNGEWVVFRKFDHDPWTQEACILAGCLAWAAHANGVRDWAAAARAHGRPGIVGELPTGLDLLTEDPNTGEKSISLEAAKFHAMLVDLVEGSVGAGIRPAGAKTDVLFNGSTAWQVFNELTNNREKAIARIYLGTDAVLGSVGGAPGVDIAQLFGLTTTILQGDLKAIAQALNTGLYQPWTAVNFGSSQYAPTFEYDLPDPEKEQNLQQQDDRLTRMLAKIDSMNKLGLVVDQNTIDALARAYDVFPVPQLAPIAAQAVSINVDAADAAKVVRVDELRASMGLPPLGGTQGTAFVSIDPSQAKIDAAQITAAAKPPAPA